MNAAEITDKLGLHSLRQRAWVRSDTAVLCDLILTSSIVYPVHLCYVRRRLVRGFGMVEQFPPKGWSQLKGPDAALPGLLWLPAKLRTLPYPCPLPIFPWGRRFDSSSQSER